MTILVSGGGSGGHITPILAVAAEVKRLRPDAQVVFVGQRGDVLLDVPKNDHNIDQCYAISAGKLRRYSNEGYKQLLDLKTQWLNLRDALKTLAGIFQSWRLIKRLAPDIVFTRGGFVSVPVALAAKLCHVPYVTHDSDSTPSLANKIIARWAKAHLVALDPSFYPYPKAKTIQVGVPISADYQSVNQAKQQALKRELGLDKYRQLICVTGGGNGARKLNLLVQANARYLFERFPELAIVTIAGRGQDESLKSAYQELGPEYAKRAVVKDFVSDLFRYTGAADLVIGRGGATNLAEFAVQGRACIIIPSPQLGWNVANARSLASLGAIEFLSEEQAEQEQRLGRLVAELLDNPARRQALSSAMQKTALTGSAERIANYLIASKDSNSGV